MARIQGVDLPGDKHVVIALQYIYGIGDWVAAEICFRLGIDPFLKASALTDDAVARISGLLDKDYLVEGQLRRSIQQNIARLRDIQCYRGMRHRRNLPVRGQRTRTNARLARESRKPLLVRKV